MQRAVDMVEAATVLISGWSYAQLDGVSFSCDDVQEDLLRQKNLYRDDDYYRLYIVPNSYPTVYVKEYTGCFNKAILEFQVLKMNQNVEGVQKLASIHKKEPKCNKKYLVTTSTMVPMYYDKMITASSINQWNDIDLSQ